MSTSADLPSELNSSLVCKEEALPYISSTNNPTDLGDTQQLIDSIKSAAQLPEETQIAIDPAFFYGNSVFDVTAMAPLNETSQVCLHGTLTLLIL
jgi:hypothetical protein